MLNQIEEESLNQTNLLKIGQKSFHLNRLKLVINLGELLGI